MVRLALCALLAGLAAGTRAAEAPAGEPKTPSRVVVTSDKTPLMFGNEKIGELAEGTTAELIAAKDNWLNVRLSFAGSWCQGWVNAALTVPDSLKEVGIAARIASRKDLYEQLHLPGQQFLEVRVKFDPTDKSPKRVYFHWDDPASADVYLIHGRERTKILPFGFMQRKPLSTKTTFERSEKQQILSLTPGQSRVETYIFSVPIPVRRFGLVLKDVVTPLQ